MNYENFVVGGNTTLATLIANKIINANDMEFSKTVANYLPAQDPEQYNIQVYSQNPQGGSVAKSVNAQTKQVTLTATPASGYIFIGWRRTGTQEVISTNPYTFIPVKNETFWGMFIQQSPQA